MRGFLGFAGEVRGKASATVYCSVEISAAARELFRRIRARRRKGARAGCGSSRGRSICRQAFVGKLPIAWFLLQRCICWHSTGSQQGAWLASHIICWQAFVENCLSYHFYCSAASAGTARGHSKGAWLASHFWLQLKRYGLTTAVLRRPGFQHRKVDVRKRYTSASRLPKQFFQVTAQIVVTGTDVCTS